MTKIADKQAAIISEFSDDQDWEARYRRIIQRGQALPSMPDELKIEKNKVKGCQSQVWLDAKLENGKVIYQIDSDALIVKGLAALLISVFNNESPQDIAAAPIDFLQKIGLTSHLSQSRANGLAAMVRQFKNYAVVFSMLNK